MERHNLIDSLRKLKLYGMVSVFDEAVTQGIRRNNTVQEILLALCQAEGAERKARSIGYQVRIAKFPVHKNLDLAEMVTGWGCYSVFLDGSSVFLENFGVWGLDIGVAK